MEEKSMEKRINRNNESIECFSTKEEKKKMLDMSHAEAESLSIKLELVPKTQHHEWNGIEWKKEKYSLQRVENNEYWKK